MSNSIPVELPEGFLPHNGEDNKHGDMLVEILMRDGAYQTGEADRLRWDHRGWAGDVVAYRVLDVSDATIENAAFITHTADLNEIQQLVDIAKRHNITFWADALDYMRLVPEDYDHVTYFSKESGFDGYDFGVMDDQVLVSFKQFLQLYREHFGEVIKNLDEVPVRNPKPRYRKRRHKKPNKAKTIVRVLYTTQQVYTFKNVLSVQIIDDKVFIQHERVITDGIKESIETEIDAALVMAVVIHEVGNRSSFLRNIDNTWDFQAEDGTVINNGKQLGRIFKK